MQIHLGVIDLTYGDKGSISTGEVAKILEDQYSVMGNFVDLHIGEIAEVMAISVSEAIDSLISGAPATLNPFGQAEQDIQQMFVKYIDDEEIAQTGQEGVPTQAALDGVRTALKKRKEIKNIKKYRSRIRGTRRPSFLDTGLYRDSFKVWVE